MHKVAVIGDRESIAGFAALGLEVFSVNEDSSVTDIVDKLAVQDYAIIYVTENYSSQIEQQIKYYRSRQLPAIILIPGISGNTGEGLREVHRCVEKAVGSDILHNQK